MFDLYDFKIVNHYFVHEIGNLLLKKFTVLVEQFK
jgi:GGDEF domain-containing protein